MRLLKALSFFSSDASLFSFMFGSPLNPQGFKGNPY